MGFLLTYLSQESGCFALCYDYESPAQCTECLNTGVPKGLDSPMVILLRLELALAWLYLVPRAATTLGLIPHFPLSPNLPSIGRPATDCLLQHLRLQQHGLGRGALCVTRVLCAARALYAHIVFSCKIPISHVTSQSWLWVNIQL